MKKEFLSATVESILVLIITVVLGLCLISAQAKPPITKSAELVLNVMEAPDFTLELSVTELNTFIARTATFSAEITSVNQFAGEITISITDIPPEMVEILPSDTFTLGPNEPKGVQFNLIIPDNPELIGTYTLTVTAVSDTYN